MEKYEGSVNIEFDDIPSIQLISIKPVASAGLIERLSIATQKRNFTLRESWQVKISGIEYLEALNGVMEISEKDSNGEKITYDGASVPLPWLVSFLTVGILRPLGVMLVASIVHDYAYKFGHLKVMDNASGNYSNVELPQHTADRLFRDIIGSVNGMPRIAFIGWFFVRIGWLWTRYNGKRFSGEKPIIEYTILAALVLLIWWIVSTHGTAIFMAAFLSVYIAFYLASLVVNRALERKA